jgi:hypothetical protein
VQYCIKVIQFASEVFGVAAPLAPAPRFNKSKTAAGLRCSQISDPKLPSMMANHQKEIEEFGNNDDFWLFGYG